MLKKLLSLMLLMTIASSAFCMEKEQGESSVKKTAEEKQLKRLANTNNQGEIVNLIGNDENGSPFLDDNYHFIVKLIGKFNLDKVLEHISNYYDMPDYVHECAKGGRHKLVKVFYPDLDTKPKIDEQNFNNQNIKLALYLANHIEGYDSNGRSTLMYLIKKNQYEEAIKLIKSSSLDYILAQDNNEITALYLAVKKLNKLQKQVMRINEKQESAKKLTKRDLTKLEKKVTELIAALVGKCNLNLNTLAHYSLGRDIKIKLRDFCRLKVRQQSPEIIKNEDLPAKTTKQLDNFIAEVNNKARKYSTGWKDWLKGKTIRPDITKKHIIGAIGLMAACLIGVIYLAKGSKSENLAKNIGRK